MKMKLVSFIRNCLYTKKYIHVEVDRTNHIMYKSKDGRFLIDKTALGIENYSDEYREEIIKQSYGIDTKAFEEYLKNSDVKFHYELNDSND